MKKIRRVPITNEVRVLKYMRIQAGLSLRGASKVLNISDGAISHIENGKMALPWDRIEPMVLAYGFCMNDFLKLSRSKNLPNDRRQECSSVLKGIPTHRLEDVFNFLKSIRYGGYNDRTN